MAIDLHPGTPAQPQAPVVPGRLVRR